MKGQKFEMHGHQIKFETYKLQVIKDKGLKLFGQKVKVMLDEEVGQEEEI